MNDRWLQKGKILKKTRESKGVSLKTVHESTKIPLDALKSIEEGYRIRTLTDFYYRSFIKLYANYLKVEFPPDLEDCQNPKNISRDHAEEKKTFWDDPKVFNFSTQQIRIILKWIVVLIGLLFAMRLIGCAIENVQSSRLKLRAEKTQAIEDQEAQKIFTNANQEVFEKKPSLEKSDVHTSSRPVKKVSLAVRAKRASWLQIEVDEQIVFRSTLERGASGRWEANEKIELSGRNIRDLELEINGQLTSLGRVPRRIKGIVVTKDGFYITE